MDQVAAPAAGAAVRYEADHVRLTAEAVARRSYGKLVAYLAARTHDVASAEDALSEAFAAALSNWPRTGCPDNPEAWLLTVARRKHIDAQRRQHDGSATDDELERIAAVLAETNEVDEIADRRLALMFACAHPAVDAAIRAPLILQVILGLDAATIASSFLMSPAAMAKRLGRAKSKIREAGIPLCIPARAELATRLDTVLDAIYAAFAEGWSDAAGTDVERRELTGEALFLARLVTQLLPDEPEALGLLALMLHANARRAARRGAAGEYIPLARQDSSRWDAAMIAEAEALLLDASRAKRFGRYQIEAALQSAHVARCRSGVSNWKAVLELYDTLAAITHSPVVAINRALAVAELLGPEAGLAALPDSAEDARLATYQPYWAARAELLARAGATTEAVHAYDVAIGLERDLSVRTFLESRRDALDPHAGSLRKGDSWAGS